MTTFVLAYCDEAEVALAASLSAATMTIDDGCTMAIADGALPELELPVFLR